jgi:hypothetical protein
MTKDEALKLCDYLECNDASMEAQHKAATFIREALAEPEPNYKKALEVWLDKTEWVQETVKPHELGMHRADVLKQRVEEALAQPEQEPWSPVSIGVDVTNEGAHVVGIYAMTDDTSQVFYAKYYPVPQRTWVGLTDEEVKNFVQAVWPREATPTDYIRAIEAKLKEKNT